MGAYYCARCFSASKIAPEFDEISGNFVCKNCKSKTTRCPSCDSIVSSGDIINMEYVISSRSERRIKVCRKCQATYSRIRNYTYTPPIKFFMDEGETRKTADFFGTEIEVGFAEGAEINNISSIFDKNAFCWTAFDSSVGHGFEIKILPMTLKYLKNNYQDVLKEVWELSDHEHIHKNRTSLGMHVHMNNFRFNFAQELVLASMFIKDLGFSRRFGKRTKSEAERWFKSVFDFAPPESPNDCRDIMLSGEHYLPITFSRKASTYEVRLFKTTLDPKVYISRIETLQNIKDFCREFIIDPYEPFEHSELLSVYASWLKDNGREEDEVCASS